VVPLVLPWRAARIAGSPWLLWLKRGNTWRRSVPHMLRAFSTFQAAMVLLCVSCAMLPSAAGAMFSLVPLHLANIFVGLHCANHVTHRFGKDITPS
jgi:hypothetical protein